MPLFLLLLSFVGMASDAFAQGTQLRVRAVNADSGQPVPNVLIQVLWEKSETVYSEAWTNDQGVVSIQVSPLETYLVRAVANGYTSQTDEASPPPGVTLAVTLGLSLIPPRNPRVEYGAVSGRVLTPEGEPLSKIYVSVDSRDPNASAHHAFTATDGSYRMEVPVGLYRVQTTGSHPGWPLPMPPVFDQYDGGRLEPVVVAANTETAGADLLLPRRRRFRATVTVIGNGAPVSEGRIEWTASDGSASAHSLEPNGSAEIGPLPPGHITIFATTGSKPLQMAGMTSLDIEDEPPSDVVLSVFPGARVFGRVLAPSGSRFRIPAGEQMHVIPYHPGTRFSMISAEYRVATDGTFVLSGLVGERCLEVNGRFPPHWRVLAITHDGVDITERPLVFDYGQEIRDVVVHIGPSDAPPALERRCISGP